MPLWFSLFIVAGCDRSSESGAATLRVSNWLNAGVDPTFFQLERDLEREFEAAHAGVDLRIEPIPGDGQYAPKLLLRHAARAMPDAGYLDASSGAAFINNGVAIDLMPFIESDGTFQLADYFPAAVDAFRRDGKLFAIPQDFTPMVMFYNKRLFDAAGVPYPHDGWTWTEFLAAAHRLTIPDADTSRPCRQYGMNFENVMPFWIAWLWSNGADVLTSDGTRASGALDSPQSVAAFEFLVEMMLTHRVAPSLRERAMIGQDLFLTGRAAMDVKGHWMLIDYRAAGLDVGVVSIPTNVGTPVTVLYQTGLSVWSRGQQPRLGWEWVKLNTSRDVQIRRVAGGVAVSANRHAAAHYAGDPIEDAFLRQVEYARVPWGVRVERYPFVEEQVSEMFKDLVYQAGANRNSVPAADRVRVQQLIAETLRNAAARIDAALRPN